MGALLRQGWRPRRTIVFAAWDGEEPMLLGSTEWVEAHAAELDRHAVAYLNSDVNGRGFLQVDGSPTLEQLVGEVARDVPDPETKMSTWKRAHLGSIAAAGSAKEREKARKRETLPVEPLGSGSDYTAFYHHIGVASLNLGFTGEDDGGIYHSIYDTFDWFTRFSDTAFVYGQALARTAGTAVLRLANADLLPLTFTALSERLRDDLDNVQDLLKTTRDSIEEQNRQVEESTFVAANDPRHPTLIPSIEDVPPHLNFAPLENAGDRLARAADHYRWPSSPS